MRIAAIILAAFLASPALAQEDVQITGAPAKCIGDITDASYAAPTDRYAHGVLGDAVEWGQLKVSVRSNGTCAWGRHQLTVTLPLHRVFEDIEPRLADLDGDGLAEIITVESSVRLGARLTVWGVKGEEFGRIATTPFIGQANRWLAPVGAADLDGDGFVEIAYVDRPHLAKNLRIWRYRNGRLEHVADRPFLTNHKIGWDFIPGGIRHCPDSPPEIITAQGDWKLVVATRMRSDGLFSVGVDIYRGPDSLNAALECG